tara:strand:+ start:167 stop:904 length:738 start_codon:yes stop_codon:yes gene_type:complete
MKLKQIIVEGMYDKLTGKITKDLIRELKRAIIAGMGDKSYKGYTVRENPKKGYNVLAMLEDEVNTIEIGDYADTVSGVNLSVDLKYKLTDDVEPGKFYINGFADEIMWSNLELLLATNPKDGVNILSKINSYIRETIRHEIEHFTQRGDNVKAGKFIRNNKAMRAKIKANKEIGYKYLILPDEVDANIHGLYARAKNKKKPYQKVVDSYLDSFVDLGDITPEQRDIVYNAWKSRIPRIGGIPELK